MRTRWLALIVLLAGIGPARACGPVLVSGFDDVMRQADNTGLLRAARRLLSPDATYAGMPELYRAMSCPEADPSMYVVSAITSMLTTRARNFLAREGFPPSKLHFRRWLLQWSPERFKRVRIEQLLAEHDDRRFVFVLDNSATSVRLAQGLLQAHPSRIAAIYLRETVKRDLPPGVMPFLTAFDIAAHEFAAGRLTASETTRVADAILAERDTNRVIPLYSYCPTTLPACALPDPGAMRQCDRVRERVLTICAARPL